MSNQPWTITIEKRFHRAGPCFVYEASRDSDGHTLEFDGSGLMYVQAPKTAEDALRLAKKAIKSFLDVEQSKTTVRYVPGVDDE